MKKVTLIRFLFVAASVVLLSAAMGLDAFAQSRGGAGGRGAGAGGGVRPGGPVGPSGSRRETITVPGGRQGYPVDDFPRPNLPNETDRAIPDIDRARRDEQERARREERDLREARRRLENETRREEARRRDAIRRHDEEANRFQKLARWLEVSPERLQNFYLEAKAANPNLRLGQFFAAFVIANRLNSSHPSVTPQAILRGLDSGMNLERTLGTLGLTAEEIKATVKWAERLVNHLKP